MAVDPHGSCDNLGAFASLYAAHGAYAHLFQRRVIQLASIVLFHLPSESDDIRPVNKNVQLLMDRLIGESIRPLLRPHDQLVLCDAHHDMDLCAHGAALARGTYLFFTESHVWPEHDVLLASKQMFDDHPDWAAFSCRTARVALNPLAQLEADLYEHDIDQAMNAHPWRKILDQCFVTRSDAYRAAGGFDPELGHFAEWALAARYYDRGLTVGYAPHIVLRHFYPTSVSGAGSPTHSSKAR